MNVQDSDIEMENNKEEKMQKKFYINNENK